LRSGVETKKEFKVESARAAAPETKAESKRAKSSANPAALSRHSRMPVAGEVTAYVLNAWFEAAGRTRRHGDKYPDLRTLQHVLDEFTLDINAFDRSDLQNVSKRTALGYAVEAGFADVVVLLLKHDADINRHSSYDLVRPLREASQLGHADIVRTLLASGARVDEVLDVAHPTALHVAADRGQSTVVRLLLEAGADVNIRDKAGKTAFAIATDAECKRQFQRFVQPAAAGLHQRASAACSFAFCSRNPASSTRNEFADVAICL
jgi:hypothetical protein